MSTAHHEEIQPDSMAPGFARLLIVAALAGLASLLWNFAGHQLRKTEEGSGHGGHTMVQVINQQKNC